MSRTDFIARLLLSAFIFFGATAMQSPRPHSLSQEQVQAIGERLLRSTSPDAERILFFAELDDGWSAMRVRWLPRGGTALRQEYEDDQAELFRLLMGIWDDARERLGARVWRTLIFIVEEGRFAARVANPGPPRNDDVWQPEAEAETGRFFPGLSLAPSPPLFADPPPPPVRSPGQVVPTPADVERIGRGLIDAAGTSDAKIVLFGRFDEGASVMTIRFVADGSSDIRPAFFERASDPDLMEIWNAARLAFGNDVWRELVFVVDHGRFNFTVRRQTEMSPDYRLAIEAAHRQHFGRSEADR